MLNDLREVKKEQAAAQGFVTLKAGECAMRDDREDRHEWNDAMWWELSSTGDVRAPRAPNTWPLHGRHMAVTWPSRGRYKTCALRGLRTQGRARDGGRPDGLALCPLPPPARPLTRRGIGARS